MSTVEHLYNFPVLIVRVQISPKYNLLTSEIYELIKTGMDCVTTTLVAPLRVDTSKPYEEGEGGRMVNPMFTLQLFKVAVSC